MRPREKKDYLHHTCFEPSLGFLLVSYFIKAEQTHHSHKITTTYYLILQNIIFF